MIIEFKRNGRRKRINPKIGRVLLAKGIVRLIDDGELRLAEEIAPAQSAPVIVPEVAPVIVDEPEPVAEAQPQPSDDGLDEMDRDQVLQFAKELGIKIHGGTGVERAREIVREHTK